MKKEYIFVFEFLRKSTKFFINHLPEKIIFLDFNVQRGPNIYNGQDTLLEEFLQRGKKVDYYSFSSDHVVFQEVKSFIEGKFHMSILYIDSHDKFHFDQRGLFKKSAPLFLYWNNYFPWENLNSLIPHLKRWLDTYENLSFFMYFLYEDFQEDFFQELNQEYFLEKYFIDGYIGIFIKNKKTTT